MSVFLKRIYDNPHKDDGFRVLVDKKWPRGLSKEKAALGLWAKDLSPSAELCKWLGHDSEKWVEFKRRYAQELEAAPESLGHFVRLLAEHSRLTLVYGAKDDKINPAAALKEILEDKGLIS